MALMERIAQVEAAIVSQRATVTEEIARLRGLEAELEARGLPRVVKRSCRSWLALTPSWRSCGSPLRRCRRRNCSSPFSRRAGPKISAASLQLSTTYSRRGPSSVRPGAATCRSSSAGFERRKRQSLPNYGGHFWLDGDASFTMVGLLGQRVEIVPSLDLVVATNNGTAHVHEMIQLFADAGDPICPNPVPVTSLPPTAPSRPPAEAPRVLPATGGRTDESLLAAGLLAAAGVSLVLLSRRGPLAERE